MLPPAGRRRSSSRGCCSAPAGCSSARPLPGRHRVPSSASCATASPTRRSASRWAGVPAAHRDDVLPAARHEHHERHPVRRHRGTSVIGLPLIMAVIAWIAFIYAGFRERGWTYLKNALFIPGVPWPLYILLTPLEILSTFIVRPVTLTLRLLMNMVAGHLLLALVWAASSFFLFVLLPQGNIARHHRRRHGRLRRRLHRVRDLRRPAAGLRLRLPHRDLHPARDRGRALTAQLTAALHPHRKDPLNAHRRLSGRPGIRPRSDRLRYRRRHHRRQDDRVRRPPARAAGSPPGAHVPRHRADRGPLLHRHRDRLHPLPVPD